MSAWIRHLSCPSQTCACGHQMIWCVVAGGWVCGYCPNRA